MAGTLRNYLGGALALSIVGLFGQIAAHEIKTPHMKERVQVSLSSSDMGHPGTRTSDFFDNGLWGMEGNRTYINTAGLTCSEHAEESHIMGITVYSESSHDCKIGSPV